MHFQHVLVSAVLLLLLKSSLLLDGLDFLYASARELELLGSKILDSKNEKTWRKGENTSFSNKWRFAPPSSPALWSRARCAPCVDPLSDPNAGWTVWFGVLEQAIRIYVSVRFHTKYGQMIFCKFDNSVGAWKSCSSLADVFCLIFAMFWRSKNFSISWSYEAKYFGFWKHLLDLGFVEKRSCVKLASCPQRSLQRFLFSWKPKIRRKAELNKCIFIHILRYS